MDTIKFNKRKFATLKAKLTNAKKFIEQTTNMTNPAEYAVRLESLQKTYSEFETVSAELTEQMDEDEFSTLVDAFSEFEESYLFVIGRLQSSTYNPNPDNDIVVTSRRCSEASVPESFEIRYDHTEAKAAKLPQVQVPTFNGDPTQWLTFKETYTAVIHNNPTISDIVKFIYLLEKLKGDARQSIGHITLTAAGYRIAWADLTQTYDNARLIVNLHIEALCNLEQVKRDNLQDLRILSNACRNHISSLEACGLDISGLGEQMLIYMIARSFDVQLRKEWEDKLTVTEMPTWLELKDFIRLKCRVLESVEPSKKLTEIPASSSRPNKWNDKAAFNYNKNYKGRNSFVLANESPKNTNNLSDNKGYPHGNKQTDCRMCLSKYHPLFVCQTFFKLSPVDRLQKAKEFMVCVNCLGTSHAIENCKSSGCRVCNLKHHSLLHDSLRNTVTETSASTVQIMHTSTNTEILLSTALVQIEDTTGKYHECRVLLDSGSQSNFIVSSLAKKLGLDKKVIPNLTISGINQTKTLISHSIATRIKSRCSDYNQHLNFLVVPQISGSLPQTNYNISSWLIPSNLTLADPRFYISRPVELLLGAEVFFKILGTNQLILHNGIPTMHESLLGWIISGRLETPPVQGQQSFFSQIEPEPTDTLSQSIKMFWEIETLPTKKFLSDEEKRCEETFLKTFYRTDSGRYVVSLPLKQNISLGESKTSALKRFHYLEKKLCTDMSLKQGYSEFMAEYFDLGHMVESTNTSKPNTYFIPHHAILKPSSSSTKLRVVFDASAKTSNHLSLNNILLTGPTVQQDLFSIVLRFRKYRYVFTADISKMYRQILVNRDHTKLQTIFWRENDTDQLKAFELLTVTYGTASAPYLATRVLMQLAEDEERNFPTASKVTKTDFYVDDVLSGADTIEEALHIQTELIEMLKTGGFELHKWSANTKRLLETIPPEKREKLTKNEWNGSQSIKTLGLTWRPDDDIFVFDILPSKYCPRLTKRIILSEIAKLYDPLGLLGPAIIVAKLQIQSLWKSQVGWDDELPANECNSWIQFRSQLCSLSEMRLNRCVIPTRAMRVELHGFSDASEKAYGACVYIKTIDEMNNVYINLLCSKSRVAPLKSQSLPRLELCGALLLSKLVDKVIESMVIDFNNVVLWSDSTITLCWIKTAPYKLKTFVANRVNDIQDLTSTYTWQHISSESNPADLLTRGLPPVELPSTKLWWHGPETLLYTHEYNSNSNNQGNNSHQLIDSKMELKSDVITLSSTESLQFDIVSKYSSFSKLLHVTAYCLRFINNIDKSRSRIVGPLTLPETDNALIQLCKIVQTEFELEVKCLQQTRSLPNNSKLNQLSPFLDKDSLIRVGGRLAKSEISYDTKHQLLLPSKSYFTLLLFIHEHEQNLHAGPQLLLSLVRQKYWPINGKSIAKQVVRNCIVCAKSKPIPSQQIMGELPPERTTPSRPFNITGVDFCGPFLIKNKFARKYNISKVLVAVFVCFVTKAIHLDIVSDLTAKNFISCLKRFISRRGKVKTIYSDNATTFVGADNELKRRLAEFNRQLQGDAIINYCCSEGINWKFIPPRAPNFGGLWESAVKSFKTHFKRVTNGTYYTYEEFYTLVVQIEGILNSRPLSVLSSDPHDPLPLTPGNFLTGGPLKTIVESQLDDSKSMTCNWDKVTLAVQGFWKRYRIEYLHTLQSRTKWKNSKPDLKVGNVVLVAEEGCLVNNWILGLIVHVYPGTDGRTRVVDVKTKTGIFKRAISKICKLPID